MDGTLEHDHVRSCRVRRTRAGPDPDGAGHGRAVQPAPLGVVGEPGRPRFWSGARPRVDAAPAPQQRLRGLVFPSGTHRVTRTGWRADRSRQRTSLPSCPGAVTSTSIVCPACRPGAENVRVAGRNRREPNGQSSPLQRTRTTARRGSDLTRSRRSATREPSTDQSADTVAGIRLPSSCSPHGGLAFTTRPGTHVATKLANRVDGCRARIV